MSKIESGRDRHRGKTAGVIVAKLVWDQDIVLYVGIAGLVVASSWNLVPKKNSITDSCPSCVADRGQSIGA